jgi:NADH-quinone oxidoreductase subunit A
MYFTLLVVVILTAIALVAVALGIARAISPRSYNSQKGEAYECGIPTRGRSWMQFKVGYYLFAILFLMFDVETVFLFFHSCLFGILWFIFFAVHSAEEFFQFYFTLQLYHAVQQGFRSGRTSGNIYVNGKNFVYSVQYVI